MISNKQILYTIIFGEDGSIPSDSYISARLNDEILQVIERLNEENLDVSFFSEEKFNFYRVQLRNFDYNEKPNRINIISTGENSFVDPLSKAIGTWFTLFTNKTLGDFLK